MNIYEGKTVEWLLARRSALQDALASGSGAINHVALAPGMYHEFADLTPKQLKDQLRDVQYALWCEAPDIYTNPDTAKRMKVVTSYGHQDCNV